jgi:hypothetical protein
MQPSKAFGIVHKLIRQLFLAQMVHLYLGGHVVDVRQEGDLSKGKMPPRLSHMLPRFKGKIFASVREIFPNRN